MELQRSAEVLRERAEVYILNRDTPQESLRLREITGISFPVLLDSDLAVARRYDLLPKPGQPMGGMRGVAQMGFVVVDPKGV
ncbi:MAG: redoxin domain-containing protein, partial [bacterium]